MMTTEEVKWAPDGRLLSNGPINYKIPGVRNIPRQIRVSLLKDCPNDRAVYSSKVMFIAFKQNRESTEGYSKSIVR